MSVPTELEMREEKAPTPTTPEELATYVESLISRDHDYGTCVYAMSLAATAAFNMVAGKLGVTGFQASCADLDIIRRIRHYDGPFMLVNLADHLYPQYDLVRRVAEAIEGNAEWFAKAAAEKLAEGRGALTVHPDVLAHWTRLSETRR